MTNLNKKVKPASIFIVDDELSVRDSLTKWFKEDGYRTDSAADATEALKKLQPGKWDIIFLDIKLPGMDGMELQQRIKSIDPHATIIMITAYASVDTAVKSLKEGAYDYVTKPVDPDYLSHLVANAIKQRRLVSENVQLKERIQELYEIDQIVGENPAMLKVFDLIKTVAPTDTSVMIKGESGTGKELIARAIHSNSSRRFFPIIIINCGGLTEGLTESEFFGHEKGAFTGALYRRKGKFEMANDGTIFLDEVGNIDAKAQTDLLRVIETKQFTRVGGNEIIKVDFRLICATNRDLELAVKEGKFREDLYYRLNVFSISIPPLRERRSDIPLLCNYYLKKLANSTNKAVTGISPDAMEKLKQYDWPGNVRELRNAIERAIVVAKGSSITVDDLPIPSSSKALPDDQSLEAVERAQIKNVLEQMGWNITRSAEILGIDRATLYHKIEKYGLRK
ncbi:MAG: sigma-54-dependent Fis family transcriptional regulator [candidate division Zixibacteria bacterium]|nr:sigma-54-dependent Fis family transcriptional regulator [candidate division Zixibacteria bacterium]